MERFYRALLRLYPASFRSEYGDELIAAFAARQRDGWDGWGTIGAAVAAVADVVPNAMAVHATMLRQDLRLAGRVIRRAPWFFGGALLVLALGIGANAAVFGILRAVLLQPLPYEDHERVVMLWRKREMEPDASSLLALRNRPGLTKEMVTGWREGTRGFLSDVAVINGWLGNLEAQFDIPINDRAERLRGSWVTPNFFEVLGVRPAHGRLFAPDDESAGEPLLVISHALWQRAFGGDPTIVGRQVTLVVGRSPRAPRTFTVLGVLRPTFRFTYPQETEAWALMPWSAVAAYSPGAIAFTAVGRLSPGTSFGEAQARMRAVRAGLDRPDDTPETRDIAYLEPIADVVVGETRPSLLLLGGVALLLLLITCATVANALLVRFSARRQELAVRASLGADPRRLVRQLLTEGVALSILGAAAGAVLAVMITPVLRTIVPSTVPRADEIGVSWWVLAFAAAAAGLTTVLAAVGPAWRGARVDVVTSLRRISSQASVDGATARWRQILVGAQATMATALLVSAALLLTSLWRLGRVDTGFDGEKVLTVEMRLLGARYRQPGAVAAFQRALIERIRAIPGVIEAGLTSAVPFRGVDFTYVLNRTGEKRMHAANARFVDPGYFSVMRLSVARGRLLSERDVEGSPRTVVISESYSRLMFGAEDAIGRTIDYEDSGYSGTLEVVGVVRDVRYEGLDKEPRPAIYFPRAQWSSELICVVARTLPRAGDMAPAIRRAIHEIDPALPAMNFTTIDRIVSESIAGRRFYTTATAAFAAVALVLTVAGLIVIVSRAVIERRRELAIRGALGATTSRLLRLVTTQGMIPVVTGTSAGLLLAYWGARLLEQFLFQVAPREPVIYGAIAVAIVVVAALASVVPALRVTATPPAAVLRAE